MYKIAIGLIILMLILIGCQDKLKDNEVIIDKSIVNHEVAIEDKMNEFDEVTIKDKLNEDEEVDTDDTLNEKDEETTNDMLNENDEVDINDKSVENDEVVLIDKEEAENSNVSNIDEKDPFDDERIFFEYDTIMFNERELISSEELENAELYLFSEPFYESEKVTEIDLDEIIKVFSIKTFEIIQGKLMEWHKVQINDGEIGFICSEINYSEINSMSEYEPRFILEDNSVISAGHYSMQMHVDNSMASIGYYVLIGLHDVTHYEVISVVDGSFHNIRGDIEISKTKRKLTSNYRSFWIDGSMYLPTLFSIYSISDNGFEEEFKMNISVLDFKDIEWIDDDTITMNGSISSKYNYEQKYRLQKSEVWMLYNEDIDQDVESLLNYNRCKIDVTELNVRREPSTVGEKIRVAEKDDFYDIKGIFIDGTRTWLCIDDNEWIAAEFTTLYE